MRRPRLLIAAARHAAARLRARPVASLATLEDRELQYDIARRAGAAGYRVSHHIEALARLMVARRA